MPWSEPWKTGLSVPGVRFEAWPGLARLFLGKETSAETPCLKRWGPKRELRCRDRAGQSAPSARSDKAFTGWQQLILLILDPLSWPLSRAWACLCAFTAALCLRFAGASATLAAPHAAEASSQAGLSRVGGAAAASASWLKSGG